MNASLSDLERELAAARASLRFLNTCSYDAAVLDITRYCAYMCGIELSSADDPISEKHTQDQYVEACSRVITWLPKDGVRTVYRPTRDRFTLARFTDCREAFKIAYDQAFALDAIRLAEEGLYECSSAGRTIVFKPLDESALWYRGQLDIRARERKSLESVGRKGASLREIAISATDLLLENVDFAPESLVVKDYTLGQLKAVLKALLMATFIWYASQPRFPRKSHPKQMWHNLTQIVRRTELIINLSREIKEKRDIVRSIIDDLTFVKSSSTQFDSNTQPLLALGSEHVIIQPDLIMGNNIGANIPRIWARTNQESYSRAVGSHVFEEGFIEKLKQIVAPFSDTRFVVTNRKFPLGEVDLAVLDQRHKSLLIIEVKNVTPPDSLRDRRNAYDQAIHGRSQVKKLIEWIRTNSSEAARRLFGTAQALTGLQEVFGAVVCNSTYGNDESEPEIPIFNQYLLMDYFARNPDKPSIGGLIKWQQELQRSIPKPRVTAEEIQIGNYRVIVPLVKQF